MGDFSIEKFEADCHANGMRYWYAHEFMRSLGYDNWDTFSKVITKAMGSCAMLGIDPSESFERISYVDDGKTVKTFKLSRFACFLVSMSADSRKPEVAKAKAILAAIAAQLVEKNVAENDLGRLETRENLKLAEKQMSGVAQDAGLKGTDFAFFKDAGVRGMYNMSLRDLMDRKGVDPKKTLYDFMGLEEMAGNLFRVTQTTARVKATNVQGVEKLKKTAKTVGAEVREMMIRNSGIAPENLPTAENISAVKGRLKTVNRSMKKLDAQRNLLADEAAKESEIYIDSED
jgi:DNA-damage-inducible protein D